MSYELLFKQRDIMSCMLEELGLEFVDMGSSADPVSDVGIAGHSSSFLDKSYLATDEYGPKTAWWFCTNDAHTEPLLRSLNLAVTS